MVVLTTRPPDVDTARARDLDEAHVAWCMHPFNRPDRNTFGRYAVDFLRERGLVVAIDERGDYTYARGRVRHLLTGGAP